MNAIVKLELTKLHPGHVIKRFPDKLRKVICTSSHGRHCSTCKRYIGGIKVVRTEKAGMHLLWDCFYCYEKWNN